VGARGDRRFYLHFNIAKGYLVTCYHSKLILNIAVGARGAAAHAELAAADHCPGRKPPFLAAKHPARPYKRTVENRFT
jgi:hypothetical protein